MLANEASDVANQEQMAVVVRYVDRQSHEVQEVFLGFVHCDRGTSSKALAEKILSFLHDLGLNTCDLGEATL